MYIKYSGRNFRQNITYYFVDKLLSKFTDPLVTSRVGKYLLKHRFSHKLPHYLKDFPNYSVNMARIVKEVHRKYRNLRLIDVGANIGDSVALVKSLVDIPILCIDGDPEYTYLLRENVLKFKNVYVENVMLGDKKHKIRAKVANSGGTSHIEASAGHIFTDTLENVLKGNKKFYTAKFLKIDTDGYDGFVLRGASPYLKKTKPVIFFEYNPYFLNRAKDNGLKILEMLRKLGYVYALVYDNTGEYLCSSKLTKYDLLRELNHYVERKTWSKYFDICVFAKSDLNLFTKINARELKNWN